MPLTLDAVQRAAPDQASLSAAGGLRKPSKWPLLAVDVSRALTWGECQGSGSTPYRVVADLDDLGHKCSCPSRKFPCKHVLALLWQYVERPEGFSSGAAPDWVEDWLSRRRKRGTPAPERPQEDKDIASAAAVEAPAPPDPEDTAKKAAAAARRREAREAGVLAGLDELDAWLRDALADGTGSFPAQAVARTRAIAAQDALDQINPDDVDAGFRAYLAFQRAQARATEAKEIIARIGGSAELKAHAVELQMSARELQAARKGGAGVTSANRHCSFGSAPPS